MKIKIRYAGIFISAIGILFFSFFSFKNSETTINQPAAFETPPGPNNGQRFLYGAIQYLNECPQNYNNYDQLEFNMYHHYVGTVWDNDLQRHVPFACYPGWTCWPQNDKLRTDVSEYKGAVIAKLNEIQSHNTSKILWHRPKIEWLCYGQRSDYKCNENYINPDLWFYAFNEHPVGEDYDETGYGKNTWVRHCRAQYNGPWFDEPGYVVDRLKANAEQCRRTSGQTDNQWQGDSECDWLIKPSIRADKDFVSNPNNQDVNICRIDIYNHDGYNSNNPSLNRISSTDIKARYFQSDYQHTYQGDYMEEFYFAQNQSPSAIKIEHQDWATGNNQWCLTARGEKSIQEENNSSTCNHADIRVYWYGNCDMWIDYVRVDNDVASDLFADPPNENTNRYNQWIDDEYT